MQPEKKLLVNCQAISRKLFLLTPISMLNFASLARWEMLFEEHSIRIEGPIINHLIVVLNYLYATINKVWPIKKFEFKNAIKQKRFEIMPKLLFFFFVAKYNCSPLKWHTISFIWLPQLASQYLKRSKYECKGSISAMASRWPSNALLSVWFVGMTLSFIGASQKLNQQCQITASWRPNDIIISAN